MWREAVGMAKLSKPATAALFEILHRRIHEEQRIEEYYEAAFQQLIRQGFVLRPVYVAASRCLEIDTIGDLRTAQTLFV